MATTLNAATIARRQRRPKWMEFARRNPTIVAGAALLLFIAAVGAFAPLYEGDPITFNPINRLKPPSAEYWFGTDNLGRDVFARTVYSARVSLFVGLTVAVLSVSLG